MNKKISMGASIAYMAIVAAVVFSLTWIASWNRFNFKLTDLSERQQMYSKLAEVDEYVRDVSYENIDEDELMAGIVSGYIEGLGDENARYLTVEEYGKYINQESDNYTGIGVVTSQDESGYIKVKEVYPDSPAETVGIVADDLIISVDGVICKASNYEELTSSFKGESGTKITLVVRTANDDRTLELTRRTINIPTVKGTLINETIGYLTFTEINSNTADQVEDVLTTLVQNGARAVILETRELSCDSYRYVGDMLSKFLPNEPTIYLKKGNGSLTEVATSDTHYVDIPVVVLADATTKGTAELISLVLKEYGEGIVVGETTYGDGSYQEVKKLSDGSAVIVTTALYTGPQGTTYNDRGVSPDYEVSMAVDITDKAAAMGVVESDAPFKKAVEIATAKAAQ